MSTPQESADLIGQSNAMIARIDGGEIVQDKDIWTLCQRMIAAGYKDEARKLGENIADQCAFDAVQSATSA